MKQYGSQTPPLNVLRTASLHTPTGRFLTISRQKTQFACGRFASERPIVTCPRSNGDRLAFAMKMLCTVYHALNVELDLSDAGVVQRERSQHYLLQHLQDCILAAQAAFGLKISHNLATRQAVCKCHFRDTVRDLSEKLRAWASCQVTPWLIPHHTWSACNGLFIGWCHEAAEDCIRQR